MIFSETRLLYYTKTCSNFVDKYLSDDLAQFTCSLIEGQYKFEWHAGKFFTEMAKACIFNCDDVNYTLAISKLVELGRQSTNSLNRYKNFLARGWWIRNIFKQSQSCNCPYEFRFQLVKTFFEHDLLYVNLTENAETHC